MRSEESADGTSRCKSRGPAFRLFAGRQKGELIAHVYDFTASKDALREPASSVEEAKRICEECVKDRLENCPPIVWTDPRQPSVSVVS
jgi:hypothetical protein